MSHCTPTKCSLRSVFPVLLPPHCPLPFPVTLPINNDQGRAAVQVPPMPPFPHCPPSSPSPLPHPTVIPPTPTVSSRRQLLGVFHLNHSISAWGHRRTYATAGQQETGVSRTSPILVNQATQLTPMPLARLTPPPAHLLFSPPLREPTCALPHFPRAHAQPSHDDAGKTLPGLELPSPPCTHPHEPVVM